MPTSWKPIGSRTSIYMYQSAVAMCSVEWRMKIIIITILNIKGHNIRTFLLYLMNALPDRAKLFRYNTERHSTSLLKCSVCCSNPVLLYILNIFYCLVSPLYPAPPNQLHLYQSSFSAKLPHHQMHTHRVQVCNETPCAPAWGEEAKGRSRNVC